MRAGIITEANTVNHSEIVSFETIAMVASAAPGAIVCLLTALRVHGIGTQSPHEVWIALDRKARKPRRVPTRLRIVRFSGAMLTYGVIRRSMLGVPVSITSPARTVVDCSATGTRSGSTSRWRPCATRSVPGSRAWTRSCAPPRCAAPAP